MLRTIAAVLIAVTLSGATPAEALPPPNTATKVILWDEDTALPVMNVLAKASSDADHGRVAQGCSLFGSEAVKALTEPLPPDATIAFHWGAGLAFYAAGGADCVAGLKTCSKSVLSAGAKYINDGAAQMVDVEHEVRAFIA